MYVFRAVEDGMVSTGLKTRSTEIKVLCVLSAWSPIRAADLISPQNEISAQRQSGEHTCREPTDNYHLFKLSQRQRLITAG